MPISSGLPGTVAAHTRTAAAVRAGHVLLASAPGDPHPEAAGGALLASSPAVVLRAVTAGDEAAVTAALVGTGRAVCCYLDRIVLTAATGPGCRALVPALYDVLGEAYELLADTGRNVAAAEWALAALATSAGRPPRAVLDVGCGSGLALRARNRPSELAGWDPSPVMRHLAAAAGMPVLDTLAPAPDHVWDAALACYVLHLPGAAETVPQVLRLLRPGALLAGNVHRSADPGALPAVCARYGIARQTVDRHPLHGDLVVLSLPCDSGDA
ncbi:methyltransferase domain-containing protein [Streptomyces sp. NPDC002643]